MVPYFQTISNVNLNAHLESVCSIESSLKWAIEPLGPKINVYIYDAIIYCTSNSLKSSLKKTEFCEHTDDVILKLYVLWKCAVKPQDLSG